MYHILMPILMHITILLLIIIPILCPHSNTSINAYSHIYTMLSYYYSVAYSLLSCHHSSTSIFSFLYNVVIPILAILLLVLIPIPCPPAHASDINCVCWHSKDPAILASCSDDRTIKIWTVINE